METTKFEISDYLDSKEMILEYLNTEGDIKDVYNVIGQVAKTLG